MRTLFLLSFLSLLSIVFADPSTLPFTDCFSGNTSQHLVISTVYGQVLEDADSSQFFNMTVIGNTPIEILSYVNGSNLATLFTTTSILTLSAYSQGSSLCQSIVPPSPLPEPNNETQYCPIAAGSFALSSSIPWGKHRALSTLTTRLRAVDPYGSELMCVEVETTPLDPTPGNPYGQALPIFWATVALAIAYFLVVGTARIAAAWDRGINRSEKGIWARAQSAGFILASAISGERFSNSPALMRFCTPSMRDIIFHTQWCAALSMVAVNWPEFIYPLLKQTSWATLVYNTTFTQGTSQHQWNPLSTAPYDPSSNFSDQLSDSSSPIYINPSVANILFTLPDNATSGISSFAYSVGVQPTDLFSICLSLFLCILGVTLALSFLVWSIEYAVLFTSDKAGLISTNARMGTRSPGFSSSKDMLDTVAPTALDEGKSNVRDGLFRPSSRFGMSTTLKKPWWRVRNNLGTFHGSVLHGNLIRILLLFHLPVTIFSVYEMTSPQDVVTVGSIVLAALSFAVFSVIVPTILVVRVHFTSTNKLYDETGTLLALGPLYNHYRHGSQMFAGLFFATNVAMGVTIGAAQKSGTAQAIVILVVEVVSALVTSIWLPWGTGAGMGLISFLLCVARIVIAVLLVILTPAISIDTGPAGWVAYGILVILALIYLAQLLMLLVKLLEAAVRIIGGVGFDRSSHVVDSGLLGACGLLGCCGPRKRRRSNRRSGKGRQRRNDGGRSNHTSDDTFYSPPIALAAHNTGNSSKKGSISSGPPPSVLKPEHALRPYREESDDENGYIMGAWQPFSNKLSGYIPVSELSNSSPPVKSSGFSRVGGGRAHIDTPYAIASGSTQTFPSVKHKAEASGSTGSTPRVNEYRDEDGEPVSFGSTSAMRQRDYQDDGRDSSLPPGAMSPFHIRTKSQTAIIENVPVFGSSSSRPASRAAILQDLSAPPTSYRPHSDAMYDNDSSVGRPKKKWYQIRRHRSRSAGDVPNDEAPVEEPAVPSPATPGRSFVVVRKGRSQPGSLAPTPTPTKTSFGNGNDNPSTT